MNPTLTKTKIIKLLEDHREELRNLGVTRIGLFGSFAKGKQRSKSDLDFLVTLKEETFDSYMDVKFLLEKIFKRKIDLIIEKNLKPKLKYVKEEAIYVAGL